MVSLRHNARLVMTPTLAQRCLADHLPASAPHIDRPALITERAPRAEQLLSATIGDFRRVDPLIRISLSAGVLF